jgi:hypothetical protein
MDDDALRRLPARDGSPEAEHEALTRAICGVGLFVSLVLVALVTLTPEGTGWQWGAPLSELHWYLSGLGSPATLVQLVGNLTLLAAPAAFAVRRWPSLGRPVLLVVLSLTAGTAIESLQWALSLGRVVSPMDAVLNATGAVVAGWLVVRLRRRGAGRPRHWEPLAGLRLHG